MWRNSLNWKRKLTTHFSLWLYRVCGERAGKHSYYGGQVKQSLFGKVLFDLVLAGSLWRRRLTYCQNDFCCLHPLACWMAAATASHDFSQKLTRDALKGLTCCQIVSTISFKTIFNKFRSPSQGRKVRGGVEINPQRRRIVKSNGNFLLSGLPFLSGLLPPISAVRLQRHLLLCQGWQLWSYSEDQKELPILPIQVRSFIFTFLFSVTYATDRHTLY